MTIRRPRQLASDGSAKLGLIIDLGHGDRMLPVLEVVDADTGQRFTIELSAAEVRDLRADADRLLSADAATVAKWWAELTGHGRAS